MFTFLDHTEATLYALRDAESVSEVSEIACNHISSLGVKEKKVVMVCGLGTHSPGGMLGRGPLLTLDAVWKSMERERLKDVAIFDQTMFYEAVSRLTNVDVEDRKFWTEIISPTFELIITVSSLHGFVRLWNQGDQNRVRLENGIAQLYNFPLIDEWVFEDDLPF
ncbi:MAG: hypothetical protein JWL80_438 [Parcubacteria group bacterium]|nr:hypothetical protein [Parcubacteria group bacterium]